MIWQGLIASEINNYLILISAIVRTID